MDMYKIFMTHNNMYLKVLHDSIHVYNQTDPEGIEYNSIKM